MGRTFKDSPNKKSERTDNKKNQKNKSFKKNFENSSKYKWKQEIPKF